MKMTLPLFVALLTLTTSLLHAGATKKRNAKSHKPSGIYGKLVQIGFPPENEWMGREMPLANMWMGVFSVKDGHEIKRASTDKNGRFKITLPPGTYKVEPIPPDPDPYLMGSIPRSKKIVKVWQGFYTETKGIYDAGW
jgi:hypothetical protein